MKLKYDEPPSNFAFKFNLSPWTQAVIEAMGGDLMHTDTAEEPSGVFAFTVRQCNLKLIETLRPVEARVFRSYETQS